MLGGLSGGDWFHWSGSRPGRGPSSPPGRTASCIEADLLDAAGAELGPTHRGRLAEQLGASHLFCDCQTPITGDAAGCGNPGPERRRSLADVAPTELTRLA